LIIMMYNLIQIKTVKQLMNEKLYTIDEATKRLGLSYPQVSRLVRQGKIKGFKPGKTEWLIKETDLEIYESENSVSQAT